MYIVYILWECIFFTHFTIINFCFQSSITNRLLLFHLFCLFFVPLLLIFYFLLDYSGTFIIFLLILNYFYCGKIYVT